MQQQFQTQLISVAEILKWNEIGELVLQPKFQRRDVWSDKARSYLIDTIIRGKPIPKLYMRITSNRKSKRLTREIVDGQQRIKSVMLFIDNGFKLSRSHNSEHGGRFFDEIDENVRVDITNYEFAIDILEDLPDEEIHDIFARLNTYSTTLNYQELRHAKYFGEFRASAYSMAYEFMPFWQKNSIFTDKQILRMVEAEFTSEVLLAMTEGISAGDKRVIDNAYKDYDDQLPQRNQKEKRFRDVFDLIGTVLGQSLPKTSFRERRLLYPLVCVVYHLQFGLPNIKSERVPLKAATYDQVRVGLESVEDVFERLRTAKEESIELGQELSDPLTKTERAFFDAYDKHWVHAKNRKIMFDYILNAILRALR
jgi:hypothetical protein